MTPPQPPRPAYEIPRWLSSFSALWPPLPVWRKLDAAVVLVAGYTLLVSYVERLFGFDPPPFGGVYTVLNALVLGVLLAFRNKEAYDRWWEARKLWGQLVNDSRNLCLKAARVFAPGSAERDDVRRLAVAFPLALKDHLRSGVRLRELPGFEADPADPKHVPAHVAGCTFQLIRDARQAGRLTDFDLLLLDPHVRAYMDIAGACERIRNTPLPLSYRALLRHGTVLYLVTTPWLIGKDLGWTAAPVMALLAYFLLGVELTAEDVEEPFGSDRDDLMLGTYCETIRKSADELLG